MTCPLPASPASPNVPPGELQPSHGTIYTTESGSHYPSRLDLLVPRRQIALKSVLCVQSLATLRRTQTIQETSSRYLKTIIIDKLLPSRRAALSFYFCLVHQHEQKRELTSVSEPCSFINGRQRLTTKHTRVQQKSTRAICENQ